MIQRRLVPVYCLTALSEQDKATYGEAFQTEEDLQWIEPHFVEWKPEDNGGKPEGDLYDMYRIWRSKDYGQGSEHRQEDETVDINYGEYYKFFIDAPSLPNSGIILASPDAYTMFHVQEAEEWAVGLLDARLRGKLEAESAKRLEERRREKSIGDVTLPTFVNMIAGDILSALSKDLLQAQRSLTYGRIAAEGLQSAWCNLDIANMAMVELVECFGRKGEVQGWGVVQQVFDSSWDEKAFAKRFAEAVELEISLRDYVEVSSRMYD